MDKRLQYYYRECYDHSLPSIYSTINYNVLDLWHTILDNHPIKRAFYPKFHVDIASYLLIVLVTVCFFSAVIFDHFVFFFGSSLSCGSRTSIFDCSSSKDDITCFWDSKQLLCTSKYSDIDADNLLWCGLFLTLLSLPASYMLWFSNLYFIKLVAAPYGEITKSKIVIVSERTINNPNSSANRKISFDKNLLSSIIHQEFNLFCGRLENDLQNHQIFAAVWSKVLHDTPLFRPSISPMADIEVGESTATSSNQINKELLHQRKFSLTIPETKKMISLAIKTTQAEIKKQIALETRILRTSRNTSVKPQDSRNHQSMAALRHFPGQQPHIPAAAAAAADHPHHHNHQIHSHSHHHHLNSLSSDPTVTRILQANRSQIEKFKVSRQLFLFLRDCLPYDARYMLDFQIYIRSMFTSMFADPDTEFHDLLHLEHKEWKLRVRVKFVLAFSYCATFVFMFTYFFLFISTCLIQRRYHKLYAALSSLGLCILFTGVVIQPFLTILSQYIIPRMISRDIHSARRCCLKILKDHYFHQLVNESYEHEIRSLNRIIPPSLLPPKRSIECPGQLVLPSQRFSSENSEAFESSFIEKYRPLSSLSFPLLQLYIPQPYSNEMMRLLLEVEQLELDSQLHESPSPSLMAYWQSQPISLLSETSPPLLQEKVNNHDNENDDDTVTPNLPITAAPSRSSKFDPENDATGQNLLQHQRILKEMAIIESLEIAKQLLSLRSTRYFISYLVRSYFDFTKSLSPGLADFYASIVSHGSIALFIQFLLLLLLISLVQLHVVLYYLHPILALAPLVVMGWIGVVYYFILHTAYRNTQQMRKSCYCSDREVLTDITISVLLQCGCQDCQYCNTFGLETECDYCQIRPSKPISFNPTIIHRMIRNATLAAPNDNVVQSPKQMLLSLESSMSANTQTMQRDQASDREMYPLSSHSQSERSFYERELRNTPDFIPSPNGRHPSPCYDDSRCSDEESSSLESSGEMSPNIVIRVPGKKELKLSTREDTNRDDELIRDWIQERNSSEWNELNIPLPPTSTAVAAARRQSHQEQNAARSSSGSDQNISSGAISPAMLNLFSEETYDSDVQRTSSASFDLLNSLSESNGNPSIDSYIKALELRESYQSDRMSLYQDMILQKSVAKLNLKNRRAKSRGDGESPSAGSGVGAGAGFDERTDEPRSTSRGGTEYTLNTLKSRLIKSPPSENTPKETIRSQSPSRKIDESKESLVRTRVVKSEFENHVATLQESMEKEKYRSQEILAKRLQQKKEIKDSI